MADSIHGSCLCGRVTFAITNEFEQFYFCHCQQCRKITGSAHAANLVTSVENIGWHSGSEFIKRFEHPQRNFTKAFCSECGSGLPYVSQNGQALVIPAGPLDQDPSMKVSDNIFWDDRACWYKDALEAKHCAGYTEKC